MTPPSSSRRGFTLMEILIVSSLIALFVMIAIANTNPSKQYGSAQDSRRLNQGGEIQKAIVQHLINYAVEPQNVPSRKEAAKPICHDHISSATCTSEGGIDLSYLVPEHIATIPSEPEMENENVTGYYLYRQKSFFLVCHPSIDSACGSGEASPPSSNSVARSAGLANDLDSDWVDVTEVYVGDNIPAYVDFGDTCSDPSSNLIVNNFGFTTADIPTGASIDGITVEIIREDSNASSTVVDWRVQLIDGGSLVVGDNKADTLTTWSDVGPETKIYGSPTDTWSAGLDSNDIHSPFFGVALSATDQGNCEGVAEIDHVLITVDFTS